MSDSDKICGVAMMYRNDDGHKTTMKVFSVLVPYEDDDDEFSLKAKAERYVSRNKEISAATKDYVLSATHYAVTG